MRSRVTACLWIVGILTLGGTARGATTRFESVPQIAPAWRVTFTDPVRWQRVTTFGHLVVATGSGVHGMDPASGRVTWTRTDMPNLAEEGFEEIADTRFSATTTAPGFVFMMVQFTREDYGLARVSRATGQIEGMVNMQRDKEPVYDVDAVANRLYYRQTPTEVVAFYW